MPASARRLGPRRLLLAAALPLLLITACSTDPAENPSPQESEVSADGVEISGAFGEDVVEGEPEKILALSPTDADILLSLGVTPVAIPSSAQVDSATGGTGMYPWQKELYPADTPKVMIEPDDVNIEEIAALEPDLIVSTTFFGLTQDVYDKLSEIAPVVHFDTGANADPWQDSTQKIASALHKEETAEPAIAKAEDALAAAKEAYPELDGKVYNAIISPTPDTLSILCSDTDNLARVLAEVGMSVSSFATSIDCPGGKQPIAWESISELEADVVWAIPDTPEQMEEFESNELWTRLDVVKRGAVVVMPKTEGVPFALSFPSPLSLVWSTDQLVPKLAEAIAE